MITTPRRNTNGGQDDGAYRSSARAVATELYTLGEVRVLQQGSELDVNLGSKHLALLIYLFHERRPMHPFEIVELLGHGQSYDRELDGLKRTVKWLNQAVPFVNIRLTCDTIEGISGVWLDTMDMEAAIDARKPIRVAKLYVGEFLEGFESGAQAFDEWANKERGRLKRAWDHAMTRAALEAGEAGKWRTAAEWWRIMVSKAPLRSEPIAHLLETYARTGRREEATQAYADYTERLSRSGVADVPGVVKRVIACFPMLQRIASKPPPQRVQLRRTPHETPEPERDVPPWDLEPAPAPPDAFELTFELPEIEIEIPPRPTPVKNPPSDDRAVTGSASTGATSTRTFHRLDEPLTAEFRVGAARDRARGLADEFVVETVAMSFEKIASRASDPDLSDGNGGSGHAEDAVDTPDRPEGFSDNVMPDKQDENGAPSPRSERDTEADPEAEAQPQTEAASHARVEPHAEPEPEPEPESPPEPDKKPEENGRASAGSEEPTRDNPEPAEPRKPARDEDERDRDLYRATAAILAAFVDDSEEPNGVRATERVGESPPSAETEPADEPSADAPDPWGDFALEPEEDPVIETDRAESDQATAPAGGLVGLDWEAPPQEPPSKSEGPTVLFDEPDPAESELGDLDLDESDLYGGRVTRVRHRVTSVRKPWAPVLRDAWAEVSEWLVHAVRGLLARLKRPRADDQPMVPEQRDEVADFYEPWATDEAASAPIHDDSTEHEPAASFAGDEPSGTPRDGWSPDDSAEVLAPIDQGIEEEAPVEWYEEWEHETTDEHSDDAPQREPAFHTPAAERADTRPTAKTAPSSVVRRYWYAPLGAVLVVAALSFGPKLIGLVGGSGSETAGAEQTSTPGPSLPKISVRAPAFVETSIAKIGQLFSRSILEAPGEWVLVADLHSGGTEAGSTVGLEPASGGGIEPSALTAALEADLMQARFFYVFPRGRALAALGTAGSEAPEGLSRDEALSLAAAEGMSAVIAGTLQRGADGDSLVLEILRPDGDAAYRVSRLLGGSGTLTALDELTRAVRRRLGEPAEDIEASVPIQTFLSENPEAVNSYAEALDHFRAGRYREAGRAAAAATGHDSTFAIAHHLLGQSLAMQGARRQARAALQAAAQVRSHATERERLRILGDWLVWSGRRSDAALTYDELFNRYRDDVGALRSLAVVQRMIDAPGEGLGNLRVAYSIDRHDNPSLSTVARFLGYRGSLPSVDSLQAATGPEPEN